MTTHKIMIWLAILQLKNKNKFFHRTTAYTNSNKKNLHVCRQSSDSYYNIRHHGRLKDQFRNVQIEKNVQHEAHSPCRSRTKYHSQKLSIIFMYPLTEIPLLFLRFEKNEKIYSQICGWNLCGVQKYLHKPKMSTWIIKDLHAIFYNAQLNRKQTISHKMHTSYFYKETIHRTLQIP